MESTETEIDIRKSLPDLVELRALLLQSIENIKKTHKHTDDLLREIGAYNYYRLDRQGNTYGQGNEEKEVDQRLWLYLVRSFHLERYMLCTEHSKMMAQINDYNFPEFTRENAEAWLESLKAQVYESVEKLIKDVFNRITEKTYYTGSGYSNRQEKKRNNNGIDKNFILTTYDFNAVFSYSSNPTITDDLEKACYIIDGKYVPDKRLKEVMRSNKSHTGENAYFSIKVCKNGNTHYTMKEEIRQKLNLYGAGRGVISDGIKIKVFDKKGW